MVPFKELSVVFKTTLFFMKKITIIIALIPFWIQAQNFYQEQKKFQRFRGAVEAKSETMKTELSKKNISTDHLNILIEGLKKEKILNVYVKHDTATKYTLYKSYPFCYFIGTLGPKREQGDLQVPEGVYYIDRYNPYSTYHLSLGINYPNQSDRILGNKKRLGGDIFIHGDCVSLGCIPITDDKIKELYLLAVWAKSSGQRRVPVYIYPSRLDEPGMALLKVNSLYQQNETLWGDLKTIYDDFHKTKRLKKVLVDSSGRYKIQ
ncbi:MAG: L,D-transpeptidase family protein [Flavobacteriales bacterium]|nr:L,D-transpeptidase family protein [Flavobacteriales bacterium]